MNVTRCLRELSGVGPEAAREAVLTRFLWLRINQPKDFAWNDFACEDYLNSEWAGSGLWDDLSQIMLLVPCGELEIHEEMDFLIIGRQGTDGIEWGYRKGMGGHWAYFPIGNEIRFIASTKRDLVRQWVSGGLKL